MSHAAKTASETFDAIVIGAGIAGPCAAIALARRGVRVALLEAGQLPRHKVCGEFLSPESQAVFRRLDIMAAIEAGQPAPVCQTRIIAPTGTTVEAALPDTALALSRFRLDQILWDAAQANGVHCIPHTRVRHLSGTPQQGFTVTTNNRQWRAQNVIAAPGRHAAWLNNTTSASPKFKTQNSKLKTSGQQFFGLKAHFRGVKLEPGVVELHGWNGGYCGLVQVEDGLTNACLLARYATLQQRADKSPPAFWAWLLEHCPPLAARFQGASQQMPWLATGNIEFGAICPAADGVLRCGDAAGFIDPLTGDGMAMAARSGELAATVAALQWRGDLAPEDAAPLYTAAWQREFRPRLHWAARLRPLLIQPYLTTPTVAILSKLPYLIQRAVVNTRGR